MKIPAILTAGDTWSWLDAPITRGNLSFNSATHTLSYVLRGPSSININAVAEGLSWRSSADTTQTLELKAGQYAWSAFAKAAGDRYTLASGVVFIQANLADMPEGYDIRTVAEQALADVEAALMGFSANGGAVKKWRINGREQEFHTLAELLQVKNYWLVKVRNERRAKSMAEGKGDPYKQLARFVVP